MENSRPQLSLAELFQVRWFLGGALGLLSAWTLFYMEVDALLALVLLTLMVPVFTVWPALALALPPIVHRLVFPFIVTVFALDLWISREPLPAMIRLVLMLLGYRCIAPRGRREDLQLILLALFVVVVTGVFTVSPAFVLQILLFTGVALALLLAVTLSDSRSGTATAVTAAPGWERVRWMELFARLRLTMDARVITLGAALFVGVVGLSIVLFLALPRVEISNSFFLDRLISKKSLTGFSEDVRFGEVVDIAQDTSTAFRVDVSDPSKIPAEPYWRMLVLDEYSGEGFRMSAGLKRSFFGDGVKTHAHSGVGSARGDGLVWTIYFQPGISRYLPLMGGFSRLSFSEPQNLSQSSVLRLASLQNDPAKMIPYRVEGMDTDGILPDRRFATEGKLLPAGRRYSDNVREIEETNNEGIFPINKLAPPLEPTFLEMKEFIPEDLAKLELWVAEIGGIGRGGGDFARRAIAWLQARHSYSLQSLTPRGSGDILVNWMASDQPGHCELFAGSLVLLARAAGVPARMVTGFKGGVWNETSGHISVRNSDAHAWTEIWDAELGSWLRSDPTPGSQSTPSSGPAGESDAGAARMERDSGWSSRVDGLRIFWYRRIVNFDQDSQVEMLRGAKESLRTAMDAARLELESRLRALAEWFRQPWDFSRVAGIALVVGLGSGLVAWWRSSGRTWWLSWRSRRAASHRHDPVRREASRWLLRLARDQPAGSGERMPGTNAARLQVAEAQAELLRLRFGPRESWGAPAQVFRNAKRAQRGARKARRER